MRDTARAYAQEKLLPRVIAAFREEHFDREIMTEMGALGLSASTIPEEYGGAGPSYVAYGLVAREIERVDSGYRSAMSVQSSLVMYPIYAYGSEAQRKKYLPKLASGELGRLLRSDRARPRLRSRRHAHARREDRERLSAHRHQDLDHQCADRRCVRGLGEVGRARRRDPRLRPRARREGPLDAEDRGQALASRLDHRRDRHGRRRGAGGRAAAERLRPQRPVRLPQPRALGIAWGAMGAAEVCWHAARNYTLDRKQFGRPLAANQLIQKKLADMQTEIALGLQAALRVGRLMDEGSCPPEMISLIKRNNCGKALDIARAGARHARRQRHRRRVSTSSATW